MRQLKSYVEQAAPKKYVSDSNKNRSKFQADRERESKREKRKLEDGGKKAETKSMKVRKGFVLLCI